MKLSFMSMLLCSVLLLLTLNAKAQETSDYIITMKGDTIACHISVGIFNLPRYTITGATNSIRINPDEIKEYHITRNNTSNSPSLLEILEKGRLNLYVDSHSNPGYLSSGGGKAMTFGDGISHSQLYISKGQNTAKILKGNGLIISGGSTKQRKAIFGEMLKDNDQVYKKYIKDNKFDIDQIQNLVHWYNTGQQLPEPPPDNHLDY